LLIAILVIAAGIFREQALGQEKNQPRPGAAKWEYKVVDYGIAPNLKSLEDVLNELGDAGWECVGLSMVPGGPGFPAQLNQFGQSCRVIMKKPKS
jgi:hypothetical protein